MAIETPERREAREAEEGFKAGQIGLLEYVSKQLPGTKVNHQGRTYLSSMDGPQVLDTVPIDRIAGRHLQVYRNRNQIEAYREQIRKHKSMGLDPLDALEPITSGHHVNQPGAFYIQDGHHRVDAAQAEGLSHIRAWLPATESSLPMGRVPAKLRRAVGKVRLAMYKDPHSHLPAVERPYAQQKANIMRLARKVLKREPPAISDRMRLFNAGYTPATKNSWFLVSKPGDASEIVTTEEALKEARNRASQFHHPDVWGHPPVYTPEIDEKAAKFDPKVRHPDDPRHHLLKAGWKYHKPLMPDFGQPETWTSPDGQPFPFHQATALVIPTKTFETDWRPPEMVPEDHYHMKRRKRPHLFAKAKDALGRIKTKVPSTETKQADLFTPDQYSGPPKADPFTGVDPEVRARPTIHVPVEHSLSNHQSWLPSHLMDHEKDSVSGSKRAAGHVSQMLPVESTLHAALSGRHGRHWYDENQDILRMANHHSKDPMDFFVDAGLEAAISPRNGILWNQMAKEDLKRIHQNGAVVNGELIPPRSRDSKHVKAVLEAYAKGKGIDYPPDYPIPELRGQPMLSQEQTKKGVKNLIHTDEGWVWKPPLIAIHRELVHKVLTHPERFTNPHGHETLTAKAEKADSFLRNKLGHHGAVTVDTWHARGRGYNGTITGGVYHTLAGLTRHTSHLLNLPEYNYLKDHPIYGGGWTPARTQAAEWMTYRGLADLMAKGMTPEQAALGLKAKDIHATSSFLELYKHPEMRARLRTMIREGHVNPTFFRDLQVIEDRYRPTAQEMDENVGHPALIEVARRIYPFIKGADRETKTAAKAALRTGKPRKFARLLEKAKSLLRRGVPQVTFHPGRLFPVMPKPGRDLEEHTAAVAKGHHLKHASHDVALPHPEEGVFSGLLDTKGPGNWSGGYEERFVQARVPNLLKIWDGFLAPTKANKWVLVDHTSSGYHSIRNPGASGGSLFETHEEAVQEAIKRAVSFGGRFTQEQLQAATKQAKDEFQSVMHDHLYSKHETTIKHAADLHKKVNDKIVAGPDPAAPPATPIVEKLKRKGLLKRLAHAVTFVSPNQQELSFDAALHALRSQDHQEFRQTAASVFEKLGLPFSQEDAIGDWVDGAENSLVQSVHGDHDLNKSRLAAAWVGLLGKQKSVLHFVADPRGPDAVYHAHVPVTDLGLLRQQLDQHKIPFRTLVPSSTGTGVTLFDEGKKTRDQFMTFARLHNAPVRETSGRGEFIGGSDRASAAKVYREIIDRAEAPNTSNRNDPSGSTQTSGHRQAPAGGLIHRGVYYQGGKALPNSP